MDPKKLKPQLKKKPKVPWLQQTMRSVGIATKEVFSDMTPSLSSTIKGVATSTKNLTDSMKNSKGKGSDAIKNNSWVQLSQRTLERAINDLKSGKFKDEKREEDLSMKAIGFDDDFMKDMEDLGELADDDVSFTYVDEGGSGGESAEAALYIGEAINAGTEATLNASKATVDAMVSISNTSFNALQKLGSQMVEHLGNIDNTLSAILQYHEENTTKFYEATISMYEKFGAKSEEEEDYSKDKLTANDLFDNDKKFNVQKYLQLVKQQAKDTFTNSEIGGTLGLLDNPEMIETMLANPIHSLTKLGINKLIPGIVKETMNGIETSFRDFVPSMLARLGNQSTQDREGIGAKIREIFGKVFGIDSTLDRNFELDDKVTKEAAVFDGVTRNAITEVLPKYARESTRYLKYIAEKMGAKKDLVEDAEIYNASTNKYQTRQELREEIAAQIQEAMSSSYRNTEFGSALAYGASSLNDKHAESYERLMTQLLTYMTQYKDNLSAKDMDVDNSESAINKILNEIGGNGESIQSKAVLRETLRKMYREDIGVSNVAASQVKARAQYQNLIKDMGKEFDAYNLGGAGIDEETDIYDFLDEVYGWKKREQNEERKRKKERRINRLSPGERIIDDLTDLRPASMIAEEGLSQMVVKDYNGDYQKILDENGHNVRRSRYESNGGLTSFANAGAHIKNSMSLAMRGADGTEVINEFSKIFTESMKGLWSSFKDSFIVPFKETLFGKKNDEGYLEGGVFQGIQNRAKDTWNAVKLRINGASYVDSEGNVHTTESDDVKPAFKIVKDVMSGIGDSIHKKLFGDKDEEDGEEKKSVVTGLVGRLKQGLVDWKNALFGTDDEDVEASIENMKKKAMDAIPEATAGAIGGAALGLSAGGLLGTLIGGPVGGAILGMGVSFARKSDAFQRYVFGEEVEDEEGNKKRVGGLISDKVQKMFKDPKMKSAVIGGAAIGLMKNVVFGSSGGLMGALVGGPLAGAVLGAGFGILKNSETFKTFLYGNEETGKTGLFQHVKNIWSKNNKKGEDGADAKDKGLIGRALLGLGGGALTAALVSKVGILGAALTPAGPIGGAILGMGLGIKLGSKKFRESIFGTKDEETGKRKGGLIGRLGNWMHTEVVGPVKTSLVDLGNFVKTEIKYSILEPLRISVEPIGKALVGGFKGIVNKGKEIVGDVKKQVTEKVLKPVGKMVGAIFAPIRKIGEVIAKTAIKASLAVVTFPVKILKSVAGIITSPFVRLAKTIKKFVIDPIKEKAKKFIKTVVGAPFRWAGNALKFGAGLAVYGERKAKNVINNRRAKLGKPLDGEWSDDGTFRSERKRLKHEKKQEIQKNRQKRRHDDAMDANRKQMARLLGYDVKYFTEENFEAAVAEAKRQKKRIVWQGNRKAEDFFEKDPQEEYKKKIRALNNDSLIDRDGKDDDVDTRQLTETTRIRTILNKLAEFFIGDDPLKAARHKARETLKEEKKEEKEEKRQERKDQFERLADEWEQAGGLFKWSKGKIAGKFKEIKDYYKGEGQSFAEGGTAEAGKPALVGDRGGDPRDAEIIVPEARSRILSQKKDGIKVYIAGIAKQAAKTIGVETGREVSDKSEVKIGGFSKDTIDDMTDNWGAFDEATKKAINRHMKKNSALGMSTKKEKAEAQAKRDNALAELKKKGSYETQQAAKAQKAKEEEQISTLREIAENTEETKKTSKRSLFSWLKIFGKKGLITGGVILAWPIIKTAFEGITKFIDDVKNSSIIEALKKFLEKFGIDFKDGEDDNADGKSSVEAALDLGKEVGDVVTDPLNPDKWEKVVTDDEGNLNHMSLPIANAVRGFVRKKIKKGSKIIRKIDKKVTKGKLTGRWDAYKAAKQAEKKTNLKNKNQARMQKALGRAKNVFKNVDKNSPEYWKNMYGENGDKWQKEMDKHQKVQAKISNLKTKLPTKKGTTAFDQTKYISKKVGYKIDDNYIKKALDMGQSPEEVLKTLGADGDDVTKYSKKWSKHLTDRAGKKGAEVAAEKVGKEGAEAATKKGGKKGIVKAATKLKDKLIGMLEKGFDAIVDKIGSKFLKKTGNEAAEAGIKKGLRGSIKTFSKTVFNCVKTHFPKISAKVGAILGVAGASAASGVGAIAYVAGRFGFSIISAVNEASNPRYLFHMSSSDKPDWIMTLIAAAFGFLKGTTIGSLFDIVNALLMEIRQIDIFSEIATFAYNAICGVLGQKDKIDDLEKSQEKFEKEYDDYKDKSKRKEYKSYLKSKGLSKKDMSYKEFNKKVEKGEISVKYDSKSDYLYKQNKTIGAKIGDAAKGAFGAVKNGVKGIVGYTEDWYYDANMGLAYQPIDGGKYKIYEVESLDKNGIPNKMKETKNEINAESLDLKSMKRFTKKRGGVKNAIKAAGNAIASGAKGVVKGAKGLWNGAKNIGNKIFSGAKDLGKKAINGIKKAPKAIVKGAVNVVEQAGKNAVKTVETGATLLKKGAKGVVKVGAKAASAVNGFFHAKKEEIFRNGNTKTYWKAGKNGTYNEYNVNNEKMSTESITEGELAKLLRDGVLLRDTLTVEESGLTKLTNKVKKGFGSFVKGAKGLWNKATDAVGKAKDWAVDRAKSTAKSVIKTGAKAALAVHGFFHAKKEEIFRNPTTKTYWKAEKDGAYFEYNVNNEKMSDKSMTEEEISKLVREGVLLRDTLTVEESGLTKLTNKVKKGFGSFVKGAKGLWNKATDAVGKAKDWVKDKAKNVADAAKAKFSDAKKWLKGMGSSVWVNHDGSYYDSKGKYYTANGEPIKAKDIKVIQLQELISNGTVVKKVVWQKKLGDKAKKVLDKVKGHLGGVWDTAKKAGETLKGGLTKLATIQKTTADYVKKHGIGGSIKKFFIGGDNNGKYGYFTPDGKGYYTRNKDGTYNHYSMGNDLIEEKITGEDADRIDDNISKGVYKREKIKDSSVISGAIKSVQDTVEKGWETAKNAVGNAWDSFTSWLGGKGTEIELPKGSDTSTNTGGNGGFGGFGNLKEYIKDTISKRMSKIGGMGDATVNNYPYYSQNDQRWANKSYSSKDSKSDMQTAGCGPTAMAMVASNYSKNKSPEDIAHDAVVSGYRDETGTNAKFISHESKKLGLKSSEQMRPSADYISRNVGNGKSMILNGVRTGLTSDSVYTRSGHYVVAVGKDEDGNILINDPRGEGYSIPMDPEELAVESRAAWKFGRDNEAEVGGNGSFGGFGKKKKNTKKKSSKKAKDTKKKSKNKTSSNEKDWIGVVRSVHKAYSDETLKHGYEYSQTSYHPINIDGKTYRVRWDCSGYVSACLQVYGVKPMGWATNSGGFASSGANIKDFTYMSWPGWDRLQEGDIIAKSGHVEIFAHNEGSLHYVYNAGSTNAIKATKPTKSSKPYYTGVWRPNNPGAGVQLATGTTSGDSTNSSTTTSSSSSGTTDVLSGISNIFSQFATKAMNGVLTGKWDYNFDTSENTDSGTTSSGTNTTDISNDAAIVAANIKGNTNTEKTWNHFKGMGLSDEATAGIMGNFQQESGIDPNKKQYGGGPGRGILQWEIGSDRYKNLENLAKKNNSTWNDLGVQLQHASNEMKNPGIAYWNKNATYGSGTAVAGQTNWQVAGTTMPGSFEAWAKSNDVATATRQFEGAMERAGKPMMENRIKYAKGFLKKYAGTNGEEDSSKKKDKKKKDTKGKNKNKNKKGGKGGFGDFEIGGFGENPSDVLESLDKEIKDLDNNVSEAEINTDIGGFGMFEDYLKGIGRHPKHLKKVLGTTYTNLKKQFKKKLKEEEGLVTAAIKAYHKKKKSKKTNTKKLLKNFVKVKPKKKPSKKPKDAYTEPIHIDESKIHDLSKLTDIQRSYLLGDDVDDPTIAKTTSVNVVQNMHDMMDAYNKGGLGGFGEVEINTDIGGFGMFEDYLRGIGRHPKHLKKVLGTTYTNLKKQFKKKLKDQEKLVLQAITAYHKKKKSKKTNTKKLLKNFVKVKPKKKPSKKPKATEDVEVTVIHPSDKIHDLSKLTDIQRGYLLGDDVNDPTVAKTTSVNVVQNMHDMMDAYNKGGLGGFGAFEDYIQEEGFTVKDFKKGVGAKEYKKQKKLFNEIVKTSGGEEVWKWMSPDVKKKIIMKKMGAPEQPPKTKKQKTSAAKLQTIKQKKSTVNVGVIQSKPTKVSNVQTAKIRKPNKQLVNDTVFRGEKDSERKVSANTNFLKETETPIKATTNSLINEIPVVNQMRKMMNDYKNGTGTQTTDTSGIESLLGEVRDLLTSIANGTTQIVSGVNNIGSKAGTVFNQTNNNITTSGNKPQKEKNHINTKASKNAQLAEQLARG